MKIAAAETAAAVKMTTAAADPAAKKYWRVGLYDILIICAALAALAYSTVLVYSSQARYVVVTAPSGEWVYTLSENRKFSVQGISGATLITIQDHAVRIEDSACKSKSCTSGAPLTKAGDWAACLPNGVTVRIEGKEENIDALVR